MRRKATDPPPDSPARTPGEAADLLAHVARARARSRASLGAPWFPLVLFGALVALGAPVVALASVDALAPLWVLAGVGGMLATRRHFRARTRVRGASGPARRSWQIGVLMGVACFVSALVAGRLGGQGAALAAPLVVCVAGYVAFGALQRAFLTAAWVAVAAAVALVVLLAGGPPWLFELTFGCGLMAVGGVLRLREART